MHRSTALALIAVAFAGIAGLVAAVVWGPAILLPWTEPDPPPGDSTGALELKLLEGPPVETPYDLDPLPSYQDARWYLAYDLNGDGRQEYFVQNRAGAHTVVFIVVDCTGGLLGPDDRHEMGGDRIDILRASHRGYHDLLSTRSRPDSADYILWQFNGARYVRKKSGHLDDTEDFQALVDMKCGGAVAFWRGN